MDHECAFQGPAPLTRREMLVRSATGFGALAFGALAARADDAAPGRRGTHHPARAKNVIFLYMDGAPSQLDTFDYKPMLEKHHGEDPRRAIGKIEKTQFEQNGTVLKSPWS